MPESILNSTKKILGLAESYTVFDHDVMTHINAAFSKLNQLGVGPADGFSISGTEDNWDDYDCPDVQKHLVKTYVFLAVRLIFDPPPTSFHLKAMEDQKKEFEWRLNVFREEALEEVE